MKFSVHLGSQLEELARARVLPERGISATLAVCIDRYFRFCQSSLPQLTSDEWGILAEVFHDHRPIDPSMLWAPVSRATNHGALAKKLQNMTEPELIALADFLELAREQLRIR